MISEGGSDKCCNVCYAELKMSGDDMILLAPSYKGSVFGVKEDDGGPIQLKMLRHLVQRHCTSIADEENIRPVTSTPYNMYQKPSAFEEGEHVDILLSIITTVIDCVMLGISEDNNVIINDLFQCKRPQHEFFSRVYRRSDNDLPVGLLATYCDVSVVKFFNKCNSYSSHHAVEWCLQYLIKMFATLNPLLQSSGSGWYNAKMKLRKGSSVTGAPVFPSNTNHTGGATVPCDQSAQPRRRKSGCVDYSRSDTSQLSDDNASLPVNGPEAITLESYTNSGSSSSRSKRPTFKPPSMVPIAEEPPDIVSSNTIDMSIVRLSPDLTEPCNYGSDPLVCMPQPDSVPTSPISPSSSYGEAELSSYKKKSVRFNFGDGEDDLVQSELQSGVTSEGRIGLTAILIAIAKLPVKMTGKVVDEKNSPNSSLWTEAICKKVFLLIQKCIDSSVYSDDEVADSNNSASARRKIYQMNRTKPKRGLPQKSLLATYSSHVMEYAFQAFVQCALFVRCSTGNFCIKKHVKDGSLCNELHEKLLTIFTRSGRAFKKYLQQFVETESVEKILCFLHATLGFCTSATNDDKLGYHFEYKVKIVTSVLKNLMDKILYLDLTEPSMKTVSI